MAPPDAWVAEATSRVYGVALAVADDPAAAADATAHVLARAMAERIRGVDAGVPPEDRAIALVVRSSPRPEFRPMRPEDREIVALVRVCGRSVAQVADELELPEREVRASLTRGLRDVTRSHPSASGALELAH